MSNKTILITGATDGIGKQTAIELGRQGHTVLVHGRSMTKAEAAVAELQQATGHKKFFPVAADLADKTQVRVLADSVLAASPSLDVLINNAGVFMKQKQLNADGLELTFAVNHLAHFLLTGLLLQRLKEAPHARIINVSSVAHTRATWDENNLNAERLFDGYAAYALSKLCNVLFTLQLAAKLKGSTLTCNTLHPGVITTKLLKTGFGVSGSSLTEGAETSIYLATSELVQKSTGKYFVKKREANMNPIVNDAAVREALWLRSEQLTGISY